MFSPTRPWVTLGVNRRTGAAIPRRSVAIRIPTAHTPSFVGGRGFAALCAVLTLTAALIGAHPAVAVTTPNDPLFLNSPVCSGITNCVDQQWNLMSDGRGISADTAWDTTKGAGVTVAVIDSGLDFSHEDLKNQIWTNPGETGGGKENNGIDDDHNGYVDDWRGGGLFENDKQPTPRHPLPPRAAT